MGCSCSGNCGKSYSEGEPTEEEKRLQTKEREIAQRIMEERKNLRDQGYSTPMFIKDNEIRNQARRELEEEDRSWWDKLKGIFK